MTNGLRVRSMPGGVERILEDLHQRLTQTDYNPTRFENFVRTTLGSERPVAFYWTTFARPDARGPPAVLNLAVLGDGQLHLFTANIHGGVRVTTLALPRIELIQVEEDGETVSVTFALGAGGGVHLVASSTDTALLDFVRSVRQAVWSRRRAVRTLPDQGGPDGT